MATKEGPSILQMSPAAGCGCKLPLDRLQNLLNFLQDAQATNVCGRDITAQLGRDDAAIFPLSNGQTLVGSLDFGTPVSDDASTWGRIAVSHALSDIFAMNAVPLFVLSIVGWPSILPDESLKELMRGALDALSEEQVPLLGGHTISSSTPLFGLAVTGLARRNNLMRLDSARPGQRLILTKPIGTGIVVLAKKAGLASEAAFREAESVMLISNRAASEAAANVGVRAATDVTGYGLIGHLSQLALSSGVRATLLDNSVPTVSSCEFLVSEHGLVSHTGERSYHGLEKSVDWGETPMHRRMILCDPQTSGGLLLAAEPDQAQALLSSFAGTGPQPVEVGIIEHGPPGVVVR